MVVCEELWKYKDRVKAAKETLYGEGWEKMDKMGERMVGGQATQTRENLWWPRKSKKKLGWLIKNQR